MRHSATDAALSKQAELCMQLWGLHECIEWLLFVCTLAVDMLACICCATRGCKKAASCHAPESTKATSYIA